MCDAGVQEPSEKKSEQGLNTYKQLLRTYSYKWKRFIISNTNPGILKYKCFLIYRQRQKAKSR